MRAPIFLLLLVHIVTRAADFVLPPAIKNAFRTGTTVNAMAFDAERNPDLAGTPMEDLPDAYIIGPSAFPIVVAKISPNHEVRYVAKIGGSGTLNASTDILAIALDSAGSIQIGGYTWLSANNSDFPTTPDAPYTATAHPNYPGFFARLKYSRSMCPKSLRR